MSILIWIKTYQDQNNFIYFIFLILQFLTFVEIWYYIDILKCENYNAQAAFKLITYRFVGHTPINRVTRLGLKLWKELYLIWSFTVSREKFAPCYLRTFRPRWKRTNLRLCELYITNNIAVNTIASRQIQAGRNRLQV